MHAKNRPLSRCAGWPYCDICRDLDKDDPRSIDGTRHDRPDRFTWEELKIIPWALVLFAVLLALWAVGATWD